VVPCWQHAFGRLEIGQLNGDPFAIGIEARQARTRVRRMIGSSMARGGVERNACILVCGNVFDGISDALTGPAEILVEDNRIATITRSVGRLPAHE
jgi:hypothetical protein